jgi:hypothetical protein
MPGKCPKCGGSMPCKMHPIGMPKLSKGPNLMDKMKTEVSSKFMNMKKIGAK